MKDIGARNLLAEKSGIRFGFSINSRGIYQNSVLEAAENKAWRFREYIGWERDGHGMRRGRNERGTGQDMAISPVELGSLGADGAPEDQGSRPILNY